MGVQALINNFPLLASSEVRWTLKDGVKPFEAEFDIQPHFADQLLSGKTLAPVELYLNDGSGNDVTISGLYVIARGVGPNPHIARILVVDRRWFWPNIHVIKHFNVRRNIGVKRQRRLDTPPELQVVTPDIAYAPFSLNEGQPWKAREVLQNILQNILTSETQTTGTGGPFVIDPTLGNRLDNLPIENLEIDHPGDEALQRVLSYLPEAAVAVGKDGTVRVYAKASGAEEDIVLSAGAESVTGGHVEWISNARIRPRKIHVLFTREHEIRFDFTEDPQGPTGDLDDRFMDNVLSVPDWDLKLKDNESVVQGTWLPFPKALDAWGSPPNQSNLTTAAAWLAAIRRNMIPFVDLWTGIKLNGNFAPDADWMARLGAIQQHWRLTYRINPRWMARILQLKASKVSTLNPATGDRAPALVYADYCRLASRKSITQHDSADGPVPVAMNVDSYPVGNDLDDTAIAAPARVSIMDHDQGILHLDFVGDPYRMSEMILPSKMENVPTIDINDTSAAVAFNVQSSRYDATAMSAGHKVAVVLTAIPAGTNDARKSHLQRVTKSPADLTGIVPANLMRGIEQSVGPEMEIRINPTMETARVVWLDSRREDIEAAMGKVAWKAPEIDDLVVNLTGNSDNAASLDAIAASVAARTYAMLSDRYKGGKTVRLKAGPEPIGYLQEVTHTVASTGATETTLNLPDKLPQIDMFSLLPDSTRRLVLRLAPSPSQGAG